jgi:hypothetical protein
MILDRDKTVSKMIAWQYWSFIADIIQGMVPIDTDEYRIPMKWEQPNTIESCI